MGDAKRRLPSWMSSTATLNPIPENHTVDNVAEKEVTGKLIKKSQLVGDEEKHKVDNAAEKKATRKLIKKPQLADNEENHKVDNGVEKKGTRKLIKKHQSAGDEDDSCLPDKKRRRTKKQVEAETNSTAHPLEKDNAEEEGDYDDEELTVDDLISIAQEYVSADARKEHERRATTQPESRKQTTTSVASKKDSERSTFISDVLPAHTSSGLSSNSYETKSTVQEHSAEEVTTHSFISTGDPAQDMLDLFLGPLLKKPAVEVANREIYKKDIALDHNLQKQSQKEESEKQLPTLMKKKSSLRDKVALLLD